jgi:DNA-binding CsgD family transcriptional regulator
MTPDAQALVERFRQAAMGMTSWADSLETLARATGGAAAQIAAIDPRRGLFVNLLSDFGRYVEQDYLRAGGADPTHNPRTRAAIEGPAFRCRTDRDFATDAMRDRLPIYTGLFTDYDIPHSCIVPLGHTGDSAQMAMAVLRPARSGDAGDEERRLLEAVAPAIAATLGASLMLGTAIDTALVRTAEHLSGPTILLGFDRKLASLSAAAEAILRTSSHLTVRYGRVIATGPGADAALDAAFREVTCPERPMAGRVSVALRPVRGREPAIVDLAPLPTRIEGPLSAARAVLTIRMQRRSADPVALLQAAFALTPAEAEVALMLAEGHDIATVAAHRGAATGTVRNQVKALFEKTGTNRQTELVLAIRPFC